MPSNDQKSPEQRLKAIEDQLSIYQLVCAYGYAVDGLNAEAVGSLYSQDGTYDVADHPPMQGREVIAAITGKPGHVDLVSKGCGHVSTLPHVVLDGDRASATCYTLLIVNGERGFAVTRLSASRLELSRKPDGGWQIDYRKNQLLDGNPDGPALLARLMEGPGLLSPPQPPDPYE